MAKWTPEGDRYIREHWLSMTDAQIGEKLGRAFYSVQDRRLRLGLIKNPVWSTSDIAYLEESWGVVKRSKIANHLHRSPSAVYLMATKLGLGDEIRNGDYLPFVDLLDALGLKNASYSNYTKTMIYDRHLPVHMHPVEKSCVKVVYIDEFWAWAYHHRRYLDFTAIEPLVLGKEPAWVEKQRKLNTLEKQRVKGYDTQWTDRDDQLLVHLAKQQKYTYSQVSKIIHRRPNAIRVRLDYLGAKDRPLPDATPPWTQAKIDRMADMIREGYIDMLISDEIGITIERIHRKCKKVYGTQDLDDVASMLGDGPWGTGGIKDD